MIFQTSRPQSVLAANEIVCVVPDVIPNGDGLQTPLPNWWSPNDSNVYWQGDTMVENGTITANGYTLVAVDTEVVIPNGGLSNSWSFNYFDSGKSTHPPAGTWADQEIDGDQFILMIDTNSFTRTDQAWMDQKNGQDPSYFNGKLIYDPEFQVMQYGYEDVNGQYHNSATDSRHFRLSLNGEGKICWRHPIRAASANNPPSWYFDGENYYSFYGDQSHSALNGGLERFDINEIGITPNGIFFLRFTLKNQDFIYKDYGLRTLTGGPIFAGFCRFGFSKIPV